MADRQKFEIGLTMAGAISAGAYTAGVVDFLFEALDAIEDVRAQRPTNYLNGGFNDENPIIDPPHDVQIRAMSGTSAGSMVTAIVATILGTRVPPVTTERSATQTGSTKNPLYDCWVEKIHYDKLLSTSDLGAGKTVCSVLNSAPLNGIVDDALRYATKKDYLRPYVSDPIPIFFCVSNLRGVRYALHLNTESGASTEYQMSAHADWLKFLWSTTVAPPQPGATPVSPGSTGEQWKKLGSAALASGAFPVGLSAQPLKRDFNDYVERKWFDVVSNSDLPFPPLDKATDFPDGYEFVNADGGIFNNEPLELCRIALAGPGGRNPREPDKARRAIILIDPFPNLFDLEMPYPVEKRRQLLDVVKNLFAGMISQARFKIGEIALAQSPNVASRYAIMPVRYGANNKQQDYAIACGSLGGFGGFLSKTFRHHDFMLGRRNCQRFLARHFALPADWDSNAVNPLFVDWKDKVFTSDFQFVPESEPGDEFAGKKYLPIVPLLGKLASDKYTAMPAWPTAPYDLKKDELKEAVLARADTLKDSLIEQYKPSTALRAGIASYWWLKKKGWVDQFVIETVRKDLDRRGIHLS